MRIHKSKIIEKAKPLPADAQRVVDAAIAKAVREAMKTPAKKATEPPKAPEPLGPLAAARAMQRMPAAHVVGRRTERSDQPTDAEIREYGGGILGLLRARHARGL